MNYLNEELPRYGKTVQLVYGGGSIKKNGIYDKVVDILKANGKVIVEDGGVMPNPTVEKLYEGAKLAKVANVDLTGRKAAPTTDYAEGSVYFSPLQGRSLGKILFEI